MIMRRSTIRKSGYRISGRIMFQQNVQQQSGRWAGQDARDYFEGMDAIRSMKTMAGSPAADLVSRTAARHLAHGLCVSSARSFVNP
jgi:hypothetical protein